MDYRKLKAYMQLHGRTAKDMAELCGISRGSWQNKAYGRSSFTVREAQAIKTALCLDDTQASESLVEL